MPTIARLPGVIPAEENNLAASRGDLIERAIEILNAETIANEFFPMEIPGIE